MTPTSFDKNDMTFRCDLSGANYGEMKDLRPDLVVLPWGAIEPHNLHLPYLTDALLAADIARDAATLAHQRYGHRCVVMPAMPLGSHNPGQFDLPFCIHFRQETQAAVFRDVVRSLHRQGVRKIVIINGHGGNLFKGFIRDLAFECPDLLVAAGEWYRAADPKAFFDRPGDHADELESSVMMHYHPELVDLTEAGAGTSTGFRDPMLRDGTVWIPRDWSRISRDSGGGDPRGATAEKGAAFARACAEAYAGLFHRLITEPLYE